MQQMIRKINQSPLIFDISMLAAVVLLSFCLANYLGVAVRALGMLLGFISCSLLLISIKLMEFYSLPIHHFDTDHQFILKLMPDLSDQKLDRKINQPYMGRLVLFLGLGSWAVLQFVLLQLGNLRQVDLILLAGLLLVVFLLSGFVNKGFYAGFKELGEAFLLFGIFPLYMYQIISGEFHRLILWLCIPLTFFYIAEKILVALHQYSQDQANAKNNFLQMVGWQRGMFIHNLFILFGFVVFSCAPLFHFPARIFLQPLIALPFGLLFVIMMHRIEHGKKPEWRSFIFLEKLHLYLVVYFLAAALILR